MRRLGRICGLCGWRACVGLWVCRWRGLKCCVGRLGHMGLENFVVGRKFFCVSLKVVVRQKICRGSKPYVCQNPGLSNFCVAPKFTVVQKCKLAQNFKLARFRIIMFLRMCMHKLELFLLFLKIRSNKNS